MRVSQKIASYYCNGQKMQEYMTAPLRKLMKDTLPPCPAAEGTIRSWYENGQIRSEETFINCKPEGEWKYWKENGELTRIWKHENGRIVTTDVSEYNVIIGVADSLFGKKEYSLAMAMYQTARFSTSDFKYTDAQINRCQKFLKKEGKR